MRVRSAVAAVVAAAVMGLTACSSGGSSGSVALDYWGFAPLPQYLVDRYQKDHPGVTIRAKIGDYDAAHQTLLTALASGSGPDIAQVAIDYVGEYRASPQAFHDLREYGAAALASQFVPWRWEGGVVADGSIIGLPTDVGGMAVAYRTDLFANAGLPTAPAEVSALVKDWNGYIELGKRYVAATGKKFVDSGKAVFRAESNQADVKYVDASGKPVYDTNPKLRQAWDDGIAVIKAGLSFNVATYTPQWNAAVASGDVATLVVPAWMLSQIEKQAPDTKGKWNIATLPGVVGNDGGSFMMIPRGAKHAKEAYDFISWLTAPEQQLEVFTTEQSFPSASKLYNDPAVTGLKSTFFGNAPVGQIYIDSVKGLAGHPIGAKDRVIENKFESGVGRVDQGIQDPAASWTQVMAESRAELSR